MRERAEERFPIRPERRRRAAGAPLDLKFNVAGLPGNVSNVSLDMNITHTWVADVTATLIAPNGQSFVLFGRTGATAPNNCQPDDSDLGGVYVFNDQASNTNWWAAAAAVTGSQILPVGSYRTTAIGPQPSSTTSPETNLNAAFIGVAANGMWTLRVTDSGDGDTGSVTAANLTLTTVAATPSVGSKRKLDFFGNDLTDFAVLSFPSSGGQVRWRVLRNDNPSTAAGAKIIDVPWGQTATDFLPNIGDYDGNGVTDLSVYRIDTGSPANTYITLPLNPNQQPPKNPIYQQWGNSATDFIGAEGDYDGDGKMDYTVVRDPRPLGSDTGDTLVWYVLRSSDNTFVAFNYGLDTTDIPLAGADYDGDGKDDPTVVRIGGGGQLTYIVGTTAGQVTSYTNWGNFTSDFVIPSGDYDGDGRADFMVWRDFGGTNGAAALWYLRTAAGNTSAIHVGIRGDDATRDTPLRGGDYDGDGIDDIGVYRDSEMRFYIRKSSDGGFIYQQWGIPGNTNIPVAAFGVQ